MAPYLLQMSEMSTRRLPRKLLTRAAACATSVAAATLVIGCAKEMVGEPACTVEECPMGTTAPPFDGGDEATDASDAADAVGRADAGVVATPLDGGDGGDGG